MVQGLGLYKDLHAILIDCQAELVKLLEHLRMVSVVLDNFFNGIHALCQQEALGADSVHLMWRKLSRLDFLSWRKPGKVPSWL
jgi:hypothetical protein